MRLIDADEVLARIENPYQKAEIARWLRDAPTIERKTGKWISDTDDEPVVIKDGFPDKSCYCSECREWLVASDEYAVKGNFCPNCGADMRGEQE